MNELIASIIEHANTVSVRASSGMAGAIVMIMAMPPKNTSNKLDISLLLHRVFAGALLPVFVGPWALAVLSKQMPELMLHEYPELIFFVLGSVSYFLFRWVAIWLDRNKNKSIDDIKFGRRKEDRWSDEMKRD